MKTWKTITAIIVTLAAIAGIVYIIATYGDRIASWARKLLTRSKVYRTYEFEDDALVADTDDFAG